MKKVIHAMYDTEKNAYRHLTDKEEDYLRRMEFLRIVLTSLVIIIPATFIVAEFLK